MLPRTSSVASRAQVGRVTVDCLRIVNSAFTDNGDLPGRDLLRAFADRAVRVAVASGWPRPVG